MKRLAGLFAAASISCAVVLAQGCSSGERTTTTTSVTRPDGGAVASGYGGPDAGYSQPPATTTTKTTSQSNEPDSVLGATTHAVVTIVLLPFRVGGDALGLII
jgi:hypothetical protein